MKIEDCEGYKKLLASVMKDVEKANNCFNPTGCRYIRDKGMLMGGENKCFHRFCDTFAWALSRAQHYADKTGLEQSVILDAWEKNRDYWYMNYYQDANQPEITNNFVRVFETKEDLKESVGTTGFRCPMCGGVSKSPYTCDTGLEMSEGKICDWKSYGLFGTMGKGVFVFVKSEVYGTAIFKPVAWEDK